MLEHGHPGRPVVFNFARESPRVMDCGLNKYQSRTVFTSFVGHPIYSRYLAVTRIVSLFFLAIPSEKLENKIHGIVERCFSVSLRFRRTADQPKTICLRFVCGSDEPQRNRKTTLHDTVDFIRVSPMHRQKAKEINHSTAI